MCEHGTEIDVEVTVPADLSHTGAAHTKRVGIDACIAAIVAALEAGGVLMRGSCCGHGTTHGSIELADGRTLLVLDSTAALDRVREDAARNARRLAVLDEYADAILFGGERLPASGALQPSVDWFVGDGSGHVTTSGQSISECADKFIAMLDGEETAARTQPEGSND